MGREEGGGAVTSVRTEDLCPCGKPLHYSDPRIRTIVDSMIELHGRTVRVQAPGGLAFKVPRHYIALHGIKGADLRSLAATYGFEVAS